MGNKGSRPSLDGSERSKTKERGTPKADLLSPNERFPVPGENQKKRLSGNLIDEYQEYKKRLEQHILNLNVDPPGAPSTYPSEYSYQTWSPSHDINNQFHAVNPNLISGVSNISYDPNQHAHSQFSSRSNNQSQQYPPEDRTSKKVQFAQPFQQSALSKNPPISTKSWHELSAINEISTTTTSTQDPTTRRQSAHQSGTHPSSTSSVPASLQKPIYIGIDYKATLAERGQTTAQKRHHKNEEKVNSDGVNLNANNQQVPTNSRPQKKQREFNDTVTAKVRSKSSGPQPTLTTTSTSTSTLTKSTPHQEQAVITDGEIKLLKTRGVRQLRSQNTEQQPSVDFEIKPTKPKGSSSQQRQPQSRTAMKQTNSPNPHDEIRLGETKHRAIPAVRIHLPQQKSRQKVALKPSSTVTTTASGIRTQV